MTFITPDHDSDDAQMLVDTYRQALVCIDKSKFEQAEQLLQRILDRCRQTREGSHPLSRKSLMVLANLYQQQGKFDLAALLYERSLTQQKLSLGEDHSEVAHAMCHLARTLQNLAIIYWEQDQQDQAEALWQQALAIHRKALGADHPLTKAIINNLAIAQQTKRKRKTIFGSGWLRKEH